MTLPDGPRFGRSSVANEDIHWITVTAVRPDASEQQIAHAPIGVSSLEISRSISAGIMTP
jgi:hypothetical protein